MAKRDDAIGAPDAATGKPSLSLRLLRGARRFARERDGAGAVEFAMVAPLFFGMTFMFLETGLMHWQDRLIQTHASDLARRYRTGYLPDMEVMKPDGTTERRDVDLCRDRAVGLLFDCDNVIVDVRPTSDLTDLRDKKGKVVNNKIDPGPSGTVNVVRVFYEQRPLFGVAIDPRRTLRSTGAVEYYGAAGFVTE